jgi:glutamate-ammonia-ligase adenylyltransferase
MVLTRARGIAGAPDLLQQFEDFRTRTLFTEAARPEELEEIGHMRRRIETEKGCPEAPECAFKTGRGGIVDIEFLCQRFQLSHGWLHPGLRGGNTRELLHNLSETGRIPAGSAVILLENYRFLRSLEHAVRRYDNQGSSLLTAELLPRAAVWLDFPGPESLAARLRECLESTRQTVKAAIAVDSFPE